MAALLCFSNCAKDNRHVVVVSIPDQRLAVYDKGVEMGGYPISTSKFGIGDAPGSNRTPLGAFEVAKKIGQNVPDGGVLKSRRWTGEVLAPDAPGRDPIVSRILWLNGLENQNRNAFSRYIYIHGTAEERNLGKAVSYGCIRMRSRDVIELYDIVGRGAKVYVVNLPAQGFPVPGAPPAPRPVVPPPPPGPMHPELIQPGPPNGPASLPTVAAGAVLPVGRNVP